VAEVTVDKSKGFWQKTKETSKKWLDITRNKINQLTSSEK
jgi:hypothetical protein